MEKNKDLFASIDLYLDENYIEGVSGPEIGDIFEGPTQELLDTFKVVLQVAERKDIKEVFSLIEYFKTINLLSRNRIYIKRKT